MSPPKSRPEPAGSAQSAADLEPAAVDADLSVGDPALEGVSEMSYEDARDELTAIVAKLEAGGASLDDSMMLWRRGEALAEHARHWLDQAQQQIEQVRDTTRG